MPFAVWAWCRILSDRSAEKLRRKAKGAGQAALAPSWTRNPLRTFTLFVSLPGAIVYLGACVLVLTSFFLMAAEINRIDQERGTRSITAALNSLVTSLSEMVADEANWTEAYLNTDVNFNPAWLDSTWGSTARISESYDTVLVTDSRGTIRFGEGRGGPLSGSVGQHFSGGDALLKRLTEAVQRGGPDVSVAAFAANERGVAGLSASTIHSSSGHLSSPGQERHILWLARQIDEPMLRQIASRFQVPQPRLVATVSEDAASVPLQDAAGDTIRMVTWAPLRPGDIAFRHAAGITAMVLIVIGVLVFAVLYAFRLTVQKRAEADERDWVNARFDEDTKLLNRFGLEETLRQMAPRKGAKLNIAVAYVGLEDYREAVALYGEEVGEMLRDALIESFTQVIDGHATLVLSGHDEFAIARTGDEAGIIVRDIGQQILRATGAPLPVQDWRVKVGVSIGFAEAEVERGETGLPIRMAEAAMRRAHETGGNHMIEHDVSIERERQDRIEMQADIRRGLEADEFDLDYQPIFDFATQAMIGVEALLRWRRREGGPLSPAEFIPAAEASGLIEDLGLFSLRRACLELKPHEGLKLSVNVSTVQFRNPMLADQIDAILTETGFPPERLQLEITESFLLVRPERAIAAIDELRARGIMIALDDFGTGFSSIGYLRQFRFDRVKLDRSLVDRLDEDPVKAALVESTMVVAFAMGLSVTAEGVERREEAAALARLGCREFQGYLFSRPLPLPGLLKLLGTEAPAAEELQATG